MKSRMKNGVPDYIYYFLLEWKDLHLQEYQDMKGNKRLCELSPNELHMLYKAIKAGEKAEELRILKAKYKFNEEGD